MTAHEAASQKDGLTQAWINSVRTMDIEGLAHYMKGLMADYSTTANPATKQSIARMIDVVEETLDFKRGFRS